ncbi:MAG: hydroxyisourate hydrolase [Flavipsychrobacter sp.]|jgi:5-hydroxyisourate hydrolase|nr:hydroxyisourate hydrolase [Flavipsychrobacter sp.]
MKSVLLAVWFTIFSLVGFSQSGKYQLSSHILDISKGAPAAGVPIRLEKMDPSGKSWLIVDQKITDKNGRVGDFLPEGKSHTGVYKLVFLTSDYFKKQQMESFYPFVEIVFEIKDNSHYHVPITLSAFGYSTYRGN